MVPCTSPCGVMSHASLLLPTWCSQVHQRSNIGAVQSGWEAVPGRGGTGGTFNSDLTTLMVSQPGPWLLTHDQLLALTFLQSHPEHSCCWDLTSATSPCCPLPLKLSKNSHVSGPATKRFGEPCMFWSTAKHLWLKGSEETFTSPRGLAKQLRSESA